MTCFRCGATPPAPLTPCRFWRGGRPGTWLAAPLCAACLHRAGGSLLYTIDLARLQVLARGHDREAWLASLHPDDRAAYDKKE